MCNIADRDGDGGVHVYLGAADVPVGQDDDGGGEQRDGLQGPAARVVLQPRDSLHGLQCELE